MPKVGDESYPPDFEHDSANYAQFWNPESGSFHAFKPNIYTKTDIWKHSH